MLFSWQCYAPRKQFADPVDRPVCYDAKHMAKVAFWITSFSLHVPIRLTAALPAHHHGQSRRTGSSSFTQPAFQGFQQRFRFSSRSTAAALPAFPLYPPLWQTTHQLSRTFVSADGMRTCTSSIFWPGMSPAGASVIPPLRYSSLNPATHPLAAHR